MIHSISSNRRFATGVAVGLCIAALTACGGSDSSSSSVESPSTAQAPAAAAGSGTVDRVTADPGGALKFTTTTLTAEAGTVTIMMNNPAGSGNEHGIGVSGNGVDRDGQVVQPGSTSTIKVALKPGTYTFYCPVPGHEAAGMKGTLTVR